MDNEILKFYENALKGVLTHPLCGEYKTEWQDCGDDKEKLVKLAVRQQSLPYVIVHLNEHKGVSKEYITKEYADYINGAATIMDADGIHGYTYALNVDSQRYMLVSTDVSAFLWCNDTNAMVMQTKCPIIYIGCGSSINLGLGGYNSVRVYLFDSSKVVIESADESCEVTVCKYSPNAIVEKGEKCNAKVNVFDKELRL